MPPANSGFDNPFFHQEPAHPGVVKLYDDLVSIYRLVRDRHQVAIDQAFDTVSRQIGFVVMTTLPVTMKVEGKQAKTTLVGDHLRGTVFEQAFPKVLGGLSESVSGQVADGTYELYLIWYGALKLKLHADWMEPAHLPWLEPAHPWRRFAGADVAQAVQRRPGLVPGVREPAHWFDRTVALQPNEALVISAIDQVYPELRLADRVEEARRMSVATAFGPGVREPAHFRQLLEQFDAATLEKVVQVVQAIQRLR